MITIDRVIDRIIDRRAEVPRDRCVLIGISGIDGSGKGHVALQIEARLALNSISAAKINVDGWLNLPDKRFNLTEPAKHFYQNAIRFEEFFDQLVLPLRNQRSVSLVADFTEETAQRYRKHEYSYRNPDVVLIEGIFLFKREYRKLFDLAIWVDCSFSTALARALERKQEGLPPALTIRAYDTIYFPAQRIHLEKDHPREAADLVFANDPYLGSSNRCQREVTLMTATATHH